VTASLVEQPKVYGSEAIADAERDLAKIAVVECHLGTGRVGLGFVKGFGLQRGALATPSHTMHTTSWSSA
jgi:adenine deaminase